MPKRMRYKTVTTVAAIAVVAAVGTAGGVLTSRQLVASSPADQVELRGFPQTFSHIIERVSPAVVSIRVTKVSAPQVPPPGSSWWPERFQLPDGLDRFLYEHFPERFSFDLDRDYTPTPRATGVGSGFFIDAEGHLVTNRHVVGDAEQVEIVFKDDEKFVAWVIGTDAKTDLALLKVESDRAFPYVKFGSSAATKVGDWVVAIGSPFGLGHTATVGIVSARSRDLRSGPYDDFLQIDAPINRGNSGGPAFNLKGEVIGVNTLILSPASKVGNVGIGFSIPSDMVRDVIQQLKDKGQVARGWLGVTIQAVDEELARALKLDSARGALVAAIQKGQPAASSDLRSGDVIVAVDGKAIMAAGDLPRVIARIPAGTDIRLTVLRNGSEKTVEVKVGAMPQETATLFDPAPKQSNYARLGLRLGQLDAGPRGRFALPIQKVVVVAVRPGSPADQKGIRKGDIVLKIAGRDVTTPGEAVVAVREALQATGSDRNGLILILISRENKERFVALPLGDD